MGTLFGELVALVIGFAPIVWATYCVYTIFFA